MPQHKLVKLLMEKAAQDEYVLDKLIGDPNAPLEIYGFHAQQAVEKLLKAVLTQAGVPYPLSHRLAELIDLARDNHVDVPDEFEALRVLTPFAVEFRYDVYPQESEEPLNKSEVRQRLKRLRAWVGKQVENKVGVDLRNAGLARGNRKKKS